MRSFRRVPPENVLYLQKGGVRLSVVNETGKEAVVAVLRPGDFFGERRMPRRSAAADRDCGCDELDADAAM